MEKNEFILNVTSEDDFENAGVALPPPDAGLTYITVTVWMPTLENMMDEEITIEYPELERLGLEEIQEGCMNYRGRLDKGELMDRLERMGFRVISDADLFRPFWGDDPDQGGPNGGPYDGPNPDLNDEERRNADEMKQIMINNFPEMFLDPDDPRGIKLDDDGNVVWPKDSTWPNFLGTNDNPKDVEQLKRDMHRAAEIEDYEKAAKLRDIIKKILGEEIKRFKKLL